MKEKLKWPAVILACLVAVAALARGAVSYMDTPALAQETADALEVHVEAVAVEKQETDDKLEAIDDHLFILSDQAQWERCTKNPDKTREGCDEESSQRRIEHAQQEVDDED